jgi:hypothetical protein
MSNSNYSDYIIYVDESGDHGLKNIDPQYPIFSLAFCIFKKADYMKNIAPALNELKFKYWGHCDVVLHEHDIRKSMSGEWSILNDSTTRKEFLNDLSSLIENTSFEVIASVIKKQDLMRYPTPRNPYELAMLFCMERLNNWLLRNNQSGKSIQLQFEARGKAEDEELELEFRRICDNASGTVSSATDFSQIDYRIGFLDKKSNSTGLQIADLIARPIGLYVLRPEQQNQAFEIIKGKFITHENGNYDGRGLKKFP